jgi:two-component sensor histidine kinase
MAVHELATNALKYGALAGDAGTVRISWGLTGRGGEERLTLNWEESGGPPVRPPTRKGFGQKVVVDMSRRQLGAEVGLEYRETGLRWSVDAPVATTLERADPPV